VSAPYLARITFYPVKSLDGVRLHEARLAGGAGIAHDREYRFVGADGAVLNSKRLGERTIAIRSTYDSAFGELTLRYGEETVSARLPREAAAVERAVSRWLGQPARLERDELHGFPDDTDASGPTVVSRATLAEVASWFGLDEDEARRRFRANLEIDGVEPFWEDRLYGPAGLPPREFRIGDARLEATNPCKRCAVPSRDSRTGAIPEPKFAKLFAERRKRSLPPWAERSRFDQFYRLAVNSRVPASENGKTIHVGDEVRATVE
jgi:uncharacterized protein